MEIDWPALLADYEVALEHFEQTSKALTIALVNGDSETFSALAGTEAKAREAVVAMRLRLLNAWRDSERTNLELQSLLALTTNPSRPA